MLLDWFFAFSTYRAVKLRTIPIKLPNPQMRIEKMLKIAVSCDKIISS
jgi:hypothetical protein